MANDIIRFMDKNNIKISTIMGHGYGAKIALITAINHMNRFTGVICLDGGPLNYTYYEEFTKLKKYVSNAYQIEKSKSNALEYQNMISKIPHSKWREIFNQNLMPTKDGWKCNMKGVYDAMKKRSSDISIWSDSYGIWGGRALCLFGGYSKWVHLSTNTLPFKYVIPRISYGDTLLVHGLDESECSMI